MKSRKGAHSRRITAGTERLMGGVQAGLRGWVISLILASPGVLPPFRRLQSWQLHTTFSQVEVPPWARGIT